MTSNIENINQVEMNLESINVLHQIKELYEMPRTRERFDKYLFMLQGAEKNELILPIASFNPMGKELAMEKLNKLLELNAEQILDDVIARFNNEDSIKRIENKAIKVAINLSDDVEGSWSNFFITDYKSKFDIENLLKRSFCTPIFWTSESVTEKSITRRLEEYIYRTIYWIKYGKTASLGDMFEQEVTVQMNYDDNAVNLSESDVANMTKFLQQYKNSDDYLLNLNFFYGDEGSNNLNYTTYGIIRNGGFEFAKYIANQKKNANH